MRRQLRHMKVVTMRWPAELRDAAISRPVLEPCRPRFTTVCLRFPVISPPSGCPVPLVGLRPSFVFLPSFLQPRLITCWARPDCVIKVVVKGWPWRPLLPPSSPKCCPGALCDHQPELPPFNFSLWTPSNIATVEYDEPALASVTDPYVASLDPQAACPHYFAANPRYPPLPYTFF